MGQLEHTVLGYTKVNGDTTTTCVYESPIDERGTKICIYETNRKALFEGKNITMTSYQAKMHGTFPGMSLDILQGVPTFTTDKETGMRTAIHRLENKAAEMGETRRVIRTQTMDLCAQAHRALEQARKGTDA